MFIRKPGIEKGSLSSMTWRRLKNNYLAMAGLLWILFSSLLAVSGYLITPDSTPFANHQQLELATHPPGFSIDMLYIKKNQDLALTGVFKKMISGAPMPYNTIPIQRFWFEEDRIFYETYSGQPGYPGLEGSYLLVDVLFPIEDFTTVSRKNDQIAFADISGEKHVKTIGELKERVEQESIRHQRFILGTDRFGRDMLSQLVIGTRVSLSVGFIAVFISLVIGISLGSLGGFYRGKLDDFIVWLINVVWSIPTLLLVIAITFAIGKGFWQVFLAVGLTMWVEVARVVRGQVISIREKDFVESARALGLSSSRIISRHILPNIMGPVIVISAANFASAILIEAGLSFLGIGVQPPMPSWGTMIREHYGFIILDKGYLAFLPGIAIMLIVLSFMLAGNGLREALDRTAIA